MLPYGAVAAALLTTLLAVLGCSGDGREDSLSPGQLSGQDERGATVFDSKSFRDLSSNAHIATGVTERELHEGGDPSFIVPRDFIPPVYSPAFVRAEESNLLDEELVMGVAVNGDARAYPVRILRVREMVNDAVNGVPLLVSW